ncbi:MAG TPA: DUF2231 domain-containing protein, partial [Polyangiaceae bacterium]
AAGTRDASRRAMPTLYSKVKLLDHPVHPMLAAFPIALFTATLFGFVAYLIDGDRDWFRLGYAANLAGVVTALAAAVPGFLDWIGIPDHVRAKRVGLVHMVLNLIVVTTFAINLGAQGAQLDEARPEGVVAVVLSTLGVVLLLASGYFGWSLVQTHHVGVDLSKEQQLLDRERSHPDQTQEPQGMPHAPHLP